MGLDDEQPEMKRDSPSIDQDLSPQAQGGKRRRLILAGSSGTDSPLQQSRDYRKLFWDLVDQTRRSYRSLNVESQDYIRRLSESALQQFNEEKRAALDLVEIRHSCSFFYANCVFHHINFVARPQKSDVPEPPVKLFFTEVLCAHPQPPTITCCRSLEPTDKDIARCLAGIPPWQFNHPGVVQTDNNSEGGCYQCDEVLTELSLEKYQEFRKTRVQQLSVAVLEDLKSKKGIDLKLVEGLEFSTFRFGGHRFHHLNFGAKPQGPHNELSSRLYFAEVINDGGAYSITFCCVVDPADKVLTRCKFCNARAVIQPDVNSMEDLEQGETGNVLYVDLELSGKLQPRGCKIADCRFGALPCMFPSAN